MPAIRQVQRRGWCPTTITTSVGLQIMLQAVRFTYQLEATPYNSEPPTSTEKINEVPRDLPGCGGPDGASLGPKFGWAIA